MKLTSGIGLAIIIAMLLPSCRSFGNNDYKQFRVDSVSYLMPEKRSILKDATNYVIRNVKGHGGAPDALYIYISRSGTLYHYDAETGKMVYRTDLKEAPTADCFSFFPGRGDSLYFSIANELIIYAFDHQSQQTIEFPPAISNAYYYYSFFNRSALEFDDDNGFLQSVTKKSTAGAGLPERYNYPCVVRMEQVGDSIYCTDTVALFPRSHRSVFHYSRYPITERVGNLVYYVFEDGDSIYSYDLTTKTRKARARLRDLDTEYQPVLMEEDSTADVSYVVKNFVVSPRVCFFLFDPHRQVFYLGVKKRQSYLSEDGDHVNDMNDYPFRITVLSSTFEKIKSIDMPVGRFQALYNSFVAKKGLYLFLNPKSGISYEVYDFMRN